MSVNAVATRVRWTWTTVLDGTRLRQVRREHGLTQAELAARAGVSLSVVSRLERQSQAPCRGRTLARLAAALDQQPSTISPPAPAVAPGTVTTVTRG